jgi:hypothetical protein
MFGLAGAAAKAPSAMVTGAPGRVKEPDASRLPVKEPTSKCRRRRSNNENFAHLRHQPITTPDIAARIALRASP